MQIGEVRDRLWLWGHPTGSHDYLTSEFAGKQSQFTPARAAEYMGIPNLLMVVFGGKPEPPFDATARELESLKRVVWSIVGDAGSYRNNQKTDLDEVVSLAERFPNITGAIMDDFFNSSAKDDEKIARYSVEDLADFRAKLHAATRKLDLWVVFYDHELDLPVSRHLDQCDVIAFWTWNADNLSKLEENFAKAEKVAVGKRIVLGCYMWDYGTGKPMPLDTMKYQCETGLKLLKEGRIEGMIFLASCICDLGLEAVEWTRNWIQEVGGNI